MTEPITPDEGQLIFDSYKRHGSKWAEIVKLLPGRSENVIKNYYYSTMRRETRRLDKVFSESPLLVNLV